MKMSKKHNQLEASRKRKRTVSKYSYRSSRTPEQKSLYTVYDHGLPLKINPTSFAPPQRSGGWGPYIETFMKLNKEALAYLDVKIEFSGGGEGAILKIVPGGRTGAIPLCSAHTGKVSGGLIVKPRFGWSGIGNVLTETGWHASPNILELPTVPGSGREIPPWVLAGPVLARLESMLRSLKKGFSMIEEVLRKPRGRIIWHRYRSQSLSRGNWDKIPCKFPDLSTDPLLRRQIKWALERIHQDLLLTGGTDPICLSLATNAILLLELLSDVSPLIPRSEEIKRQMRSSRLLNSEMLQGIEALGWIVDERGLGGGRDQNGLAWYLPLDQLWESYVESVIRKETALTGGEVKVGRKGETVFPLHWTDSIHRSLGHLIPDIVVKKANSIRIVDAKYKAHLAELDESSWHYFTEERKEAHRADLHQVLAYASLYDAEDITATLVYPLRRETWENLKERDKDISRAQLYHGGRKIQLELRGLPFGGAHFN